MPAVTLRPYQLKAADAVLGEFDRGVRSTLATMATGTGKTRLFCHLAAGWRKGRVLILADQQELIEQAKDKVADATGHVPDVEMADSQAQSGGLWQSPIVVASKDSLHPKRIVKFQPEDFGLVILDEADKVVRKNKTWWRVLEYFYQNPDLKVLGVTATPQRKDKEPLLFDTVAFEYQLLDAIEDGYLVFPEQEFLEVKGLDFTQMDTSKGDFSDAELERVLNEEKTAHYVVQPTIEKVGTGLTLVVSPTVKHAQMTAEVFGRHRQGCAVAIHGGTDKVQRKEILQGFSRREFQFLCVCGLCTRGFDEPQISHIVMNRPTKSMTVYLQTMGRGTRPLPGVIDGITTAEARKAAIARSPKPRLVMIDPVGNSSRFKAPLSTANALAGAYGEEVVERAVRQARKKGGPVDMTKELVLAALLLEEEERAKRRKIVAAVEHRFRKVNFFDQGDSAGAATATATMTEPATNKQVWKLKSLGVPYHVASAYTKRQASQEIGRLLQQKEQQN